MSDPDALTTVLTPARTYREWASWVAAALFLGTTLFLAARPSTTSSSHRSIRFPMLPPDKAEFSARANTTLNVPSFALSPDGHALVFSAQMPGVKPTLWVRSLDDVDARQVAGTEGAQDPFWSPDSQWIGFFADGMLKQARADGGAVQVIMQTTNDFRGATWGSRDTNLVASGVDGIGSVNAAGGTVTPITVVESSSRRALIEIRRFCQTAVISCIRSTGSSDRNGVHLGSLDGKTKKRLIPVPTSAVYAHPGYVLFVNGDALFGQAFDADRLELKGQPFFVASHVGRSTSNTSAVSASLTGSVAYGPLLARNGRLTWMDRRGNPLGSRGAREGDYTDFRLSPDETRLAASMVDPKTSVVELWTIDLERGSQSRVGSGGAVTASGVWSPDGTRLAYRSNRTGMIDLYERSAAGGGGDRSLLPKDFYRTSDYTATDWSPNGRQLIGAAPTSGTANDLWLLPLGDRAKPVTFIGSPAEEMHGNFSPVGNLVPYSSNESGRFEIYVETVPRSDRRWPVSTNGGYEPRWRADGREIYYLSGDRTLMAVPVGAAPSFGIPTPLFQTHVPLGVTSLRTHYVPSRDGQRFLVNSAIDSPSSPITVVVNWTPHAQ